MISSEFPDSTCYLQSAYQSCNAEIKAASLYAANNESLQSRRAAKSDDKDEGT